jgi:hypothetical protein
MTQPDNASGAVVQLSADEAIVLFELLSRWMQDRGKPTPPSSCFDDPAECAVLSGVLADLERQLAEPFQADYLDRLSSARGRLTGNWTGLALRD